MSCSVVSNSATPWTVAHQAPSVHEVLQARILEGVAISFSGGLPNPGMEPVSPTLRADALLTEPGKPKKGSDTHNTGVSHHGWLWPGAQPGSPDGPLKAQADPLSSSGHQPELPSPTPPHHHCSATQTLPGKTAVTGSFPRPLSRLRLMYGPPGSWPLGGTGFINKIYHCNYGSCREWRTFTASWRS